MRRTTRSTRRRFLGTMRLSSASSRYCNVVRKDTNVVVAKAEHVPSKRLRPSGFGPRQICPEDTADCYVLVTASARVWHRPMEGAVVSWSLELIGSTCVMDVGHRGCHQTSSHSADLTTSCRM